MADAFPRMISHAQRDWLKRKTSHSKVTIFFLNREHETDVQIVQLSLNIAQLSFIDLERGGFGKILPSVIIFSPE
jgi:hypothetical protein